MRSEAPLRMTHDPQPREMHSEWVRMRTLILLRWAAITGQLAAIIVAVTRYDIMLDLPLCLAVVGAAIAANLVSIFLFPENRRLTENEAAATLCFDITQLALLLALTGGLNNPFAVLILAPATIAATALRTNATIYLVAATIVMITAVAIFHLPLVTLGGEEISVPADFEFGFWLAIVIGVVFMGLYARRIASEIHSMGDALLATQMALSREQKLTDLGGVVAAAAHELGTPLATIKLVSAELADELTDPVHREDALLIRAQADRCRDILQSMGRAGKDDLHLRTAPLMAVLREAAEPHLDRGREIVFATAPGAERQPTIHRLPELIHALRNLIQNAVDFAQTTVWVDARWSATDIRVTISDDGPGYTPAVLSRIGDPFIGKRPDEREIRPQYQGMGLGLFIAKTLLERTGARLIFGNGADPFLAAGERGERSGAQVTLIWPREALVAPESTALGENQRFEI
ncbi:sensor histidine kinase RegB [Phaeovulum sp. W22_SRMD_FR3]|uniref:sensor histidine kinase RegB n=1 Tax=Phaeovulum sp. W22_SRMD_FR3 TaxID=3240274 RepID=UPI003F9D64BC